MATPPCARVSSDRLRRGPKLHTSQSRRSAELQGNTCFTGRAARRRQVARRLVGDVQRSATERVGSASRRRRPDIEAVGSELSASTRHDSLLPLELLSDGWHRALILAQQGFVEPAHSRNLAGPDLHRHHPSTRRLLRARHLGSGASKCRGQPLNRAVLFRQYAMGAIESARRTGPGLHGSSQPRRRRRVVAIDRWPPTPRL